MHKSILLPMALLAVGCVKPLELTESDAPYFILANFDAEDTNELERAIGERMLPFMEDQLAAVEDPSDDFDDTWLASIPNLTAADLGDLSVPTGVELDAIEFPIARVRSSNFDVAAQRELALEPNRACIESETTIWARRTFTEGGDCFGDGSCDRLTATQPTNKKNPLTEIWYDQFFDHRVFTVRDEDGNDREAMIVRAWLDERWFSRSGNNSWDQLYQIDVIVDDGNGGSIGWVGYWTSLQVSGLLDSLFQSSLREGLHQSAQWGEHFMQTGNAHEDCPNDRAGEEPERWENVEG